MILREIRLNPFAGLYDHRVAFENGLTVVLGPNEAGKSTLLNALRLALFVPSEPNKRTFDKDVGPFMPIKGGNTIRVSLTFCVDGGSYSLKKSWGAKPVAELRGPSNELVVGSSPVQERLNTLLKFRRGTYESTLFAMQGRLPSTLDEIDMHSDAFQDFAEQVRRAFLETDGVSIDGLQEAIQKKHDAYYSHWDLTLNQPERNRGIENPWMQSRGIILQAYYDQEKTRNELEEVIEYENRLAELYRRLENRRDRMASLQNSANKMKDTVEALKDRAMLEKERKSTADELKRLRKIAQEWPKVKQVIARYTKQLASADKKAAGMAEEVKKAEQANELRARRRKFEQAEKLEAKLRRETSKLKKIKAVTESDIEQLRELSEIRSRLEASVEAGKLSLVFAAKRDTKISYKRDFDKAKTGNIKEGKALRISAGGQIQIAHASWDIEVRSGDSDFKDVQNELEKTSTAYEKLLEKFGTGDMRSAERIFQTYTSTRERQQEIRAELEELLDGERFEELKKTVDKLGGTKKGASDIALGVEQGKLIGEIKALKDKIREENSRSLEWRLDFDSIEGLEEAIKEKEGEMKATRNQLSSLKPVPSGVQSADKYLKEYESKVTELEEASEHIREDELEKARLEAQTPGEASEQLEEYLVCLEERLRRVKEEGKAVDVLRSRFLRLRQELDSESPRKWLQEFEKVVQPLTRVRYKALNLKDGATSATTRNSSGVDLPFDLLSMGTKAVLGLALRLTMARHFIASGGGFLVLDDPLVDMDPQRQELAAEVLQEFAEKAQTIVLTCHPECAQLLGGTKVSFDVD